jgi:biopolymer transport protein ExbD
MASSARRRGLITDINVTPLVDIMLVLLITFMLTAHLIARQAIEIKLPRAAQGAPLIPSTLTVTLTREGRLYLNGSPVGGDALGAAVRSAVLKDPATQVIIAGDKDVTHGRVVWVLDLVKAHGVSSFAIQIDPAGLTPPLEPR